MPRFRPWFARVDDGIARVERAVLLGMTALMLLLVVGQVGLRPAGVNLPWADELARYLMLWVAILGASLATRARSHITIDILARAFSPRGRAWASLASGLVGAVLCGWLCAVGIHYVAVEVKSGYASKALGAPFWLVKSILPLGLAVVSFRFLRGAVEDAAALRDRDFARFTRRDPAAPGAAEAAP